MTHRPIIKLRKWERKVLLPSFWLSLMPGQYFGRHIHPQPFFSKFGVDYDQQRDQLCNLSDDTCKIIKRLDGRKI